MKKLVVKDKLETTKVCMQYLQQHSDITVSEETMRKTLRESGLHNCILQKKPALTEESKEARVVRARELIRYMPEQCLLRRKDLWPGHDWTEALSLAAGAV